MHILNNNVHLSITTGRALNFASLRWSQQSIVHFELLYEHVQLLEMRAYLHPLVSSISSKIHSLGGFKFESAIAVRRTSFFRCSQTGLCCSASNFWLAFCLVPKEQGPPDASRTFRPLPHCSKEIISHCHLPYSNLLVSPKHSAQSAKENPALVGSRQNCAPSSTAVAKDFQGIHGNGLVFEGHLEDAVYLFPRSSASQPLGILLLVMFCSIMVLSRVCEPQCKLEHISYPCRTFRDA